MATDGHLDIQYSNSRVSPSSAIWLISYGFGCSVRYEFVPISSIGMISSSSIVFFRSIFECACPPGISSMIAGSEVNSEVISEVNSDVISEEV